MTRAILIDDEPLAREVVKEYLEDYPQIEVVAECGDGFEGVKAVTQHQPDLIFLDIQMPKITGFEMLELLDTRPAVIFTSAFDEYAIKAFETHAVDYLLKPFAKARFKQAVDKWLDQQNLTEARQQVQALLDSGTSTQVYNERIVVKDRSTIKIIPAVDVHYLEAYDDYVKIHTAGGTFLKNKTMAFFENSLDDKQFVRIHRSFIVQVSQITGIVPYEKESYKLLIKSGESLPVSKTGYAKLKQLLQM
ncbi:LytTR family two component transcriptional regulator [Arcticibacter tournemirensis]|uniref:Response regulator n=1 Tax=Arcticibacter tournemirensis TaxID=699437 RepID=A0A4Q0M3U0_9SPHI|nr:response regulator [Arcticibacter tournemirensis]KAA8473771.1 response regulator [Arcticibacter tournemirensis]RXF67266.1 response regulator [Arcticibacter tournemirensis]TQM52466.1 LytTR family two component transcriptional regulator [Arcticibacter tournemirensis]